MRETWITLAKELGFTKTAVYSWRKLAGAPKTPNLVSWTKFVEENDLGVSGNRVTKGREYWLIEKLKRDVARNELKFKQESGAVIEIDTVADFVAQMGFSCRQWAYEIARELPRQIIGLELAESQLRARDFADRLVDELAAGIDSWWPEEQKPPDLEKVDPIPKKPAKKKTTVKRVARKKPAKKRATVKKMAKKKPAKKPRQVKKTAKKRAKK